MFIFKTWKNFVKNKMISLEIQKNKSSCLIGLMHSLKILKDFNFLLNSSFVTIIKKNIRISY